ncbi:hypothetical protein [Metabacillus flavus]|nr:hypothetical protein [Metabacillus flavus]
MQEEELVAKAKQGNTAAFHQLVEKYRPAGCIEIFNHQRIQPL